MSNIQCMTRLPIRWYSLMPGDATHYRFGVFEIDSPSRVFVPSGPSQAALFPGTGDGEGYVGVLIAMPHGQGYYELRKESIRNIHRPYVNYVLGHMNDSLRLYTVCAVLLALSVLIDEPDALEEACSAMLCVPAVLFPKEAT